MNTINFVISPDILPKQFIQWYRLNNALQKSLNQPVHLIIAESIEHFRTLCQTSPEVVYATPFTVGKLMKEKGYIPIAAPKNHSDEALIFSRTDSDIQILSDVKAGMKIASLPNIDVQRIGQRLLEAVDIYEYSGEWSVFSQPQAILRHVANGNIDLGLLPVHLYYDLESETQDQYNVLIVSALSVMRHVFLVNPKTETLPERLQETLITASQDSRYTSIFLELNCEQGLEPISKEEALFMVDIVETLEN